MTVRGKLTDRQLQITVRISAAVLDMSETCSARRIKTTHNLTFRKTKENMEYYVKVGWQFHGILGIFILYEQTHTACSKLQVGKKDLVM